MISLGRGQTLPCPRPCRNCGVFCLPGRSCLAGWASRYPCLLAWVAPRRGSGS